MVPPSYMQSVVDRNIVMRRVTVLYIFCTTVTHKQVYCQVTVPVFHYSTATCFGLNLQPSSVSHNIKNTDTMCTANVFKCSGCLKMTTGCSRSMY